MKEYGERGTSDIQTQLWHCPECGVIMKEALRSREAKGHYVWYECTRPGCDGAYLLRLNPERPASNRTAPVTPAM